MKNSTGSAPIGCLIILCATFCFFGCGGGSGITVGKIAEPKKDEVPIKTHGEEQTIVLQAVMDVMTLNSDDYRGSNFGWDELLMIGSDRDGWVWHSFLQFDLNQIPVGSQITSCVLSLYPREAYNGYEESVDFGVYAVTYNWNESDLKWDNQPRTESTPIVLKRIQRSGLEADTFDITALAQRWISGELTNYGVMVKSQDEYVDVRRGYFSTNVNDSSVFPSLTITYVPLQ